MRKALSRDKYGISTRLPGGFADGREVVVRPEDTYF